MVNLAMFTFVCQVVLITQFGHGIYEKVVNCNSMIFSLKYFHSDIALQEIGQLWGKNFKIVMLCAIQYHVHNLKNLKKTHERVLLSVKMQAKARNFAKSNTPPWVFFTFFKLYEWYQIAQSTKMKLLQCLFGTKIPVTIEGFEL